MNLNWQIHDGDCLEVLRKMEMNSVDSLVTDPPAGISFMGKAWDDDKGGRKEWITWLETVMRECLRVMKPGAHGLVWAIPRTSHWTATALEDAGFEIRDVVTHLFGSGFPKSLDVSKAIDKAAGAKREVVNTIRKTPSAAKCHEGWERPWAEGKTTMDITAPSTGAAKQWSGWGTALKPASEHWILIRKPCSEKTVAANVLRWGCGAINIDASRVGLDGGTRAVNHAKKLDGRYARWDEGSKGARNKIESLNAGRFPSNLILSHTPYCSDEMCDIECAIKMLDEQSGVSKSTGGKTGKLGYHGADGSNPGSNAGGLGDSGGASRFFYVAKASKSDKNAGLEGMPLQTYRTGCGGKMPIDDEGKERDRFQAQAQNIHPTVKSTKLMSYLITLVTPPGGTVLDCFAGSGSTGVAALKEGFRFVGIEKEQEYFSIAKMRCLNAVEAE